MVSDCTLKLKFDHFREQKSEWTNHNEKHAKPVNDWRLHNQSQLGLDMQQCYWPIGNDASRVSGSESVCLHPTLKCEHKLHYYNKKKPYCSLINI